MKYYDVMVDLETTGVHPDENAIIQIAAVKFNLGERTIDQSSFFDRCLHIPTKRFWSEETRSWWLGKNREVYNTLVPRMEDPETVLRDLVDWVVKDSDSDEPRRFWSKPSHFDYPFLQSYLDQFDILNPFHYRFTMDVNSYIRGLGKDPLTELNYREFQGPAHNALVDAINQIGNLFSAADFHGQKIGV